jgi:hypothetical protein
MSDLLVGHGRCAIDVASGTRLGGYLAREGGATCTLDHLEMAAVLLRRGDDTAVVCVAAVLAVDGAAADATRSRARLPGVWAVAATGAAGAMSTRPHRRAQTPGELARLGDVVDAGRDAAASLRPGA